MLENHDEAVEYIEDFIGKLVNHKYMKCLEAACGSGLLTRDLLARKYDSIDF